MNSEKKALRIRMNSNDRKAVRDRWFTEREEVLCHWCGKKLHDSKRRLNDGGYVTIDHLLETAYGGVDNFDNLVPACVKCNSSRSSIMATVVFDIAGPPKEFDCLDEKYIVDLNKEKE